MDLTPFREKIDVIDRQLVELINERLALAAEIGKAKRSVGGKIYVAEREAEVLRKVTSLSKGPIKNDALKAIYCEIMSAAIALEKPLQIAYLGPESTNSHQAAIRKFGSSVDYHAMTSFADIFTAVEKKEVDYGIIPIENSTDGSVRDAIDQFVSSELKIVAQLYMEISYCLITNEPLDQIKKVYSKDQALAQCRLWLQRHLPNVELCDASSTARAVQIASEQPGAAAVANELASVRYGVPILARNIEDKANNMTRFFVIGREPSGAVGGGRDMTSLLVLLDENAALHSGTLLKMVEPLSKRGINLSKIESRPSRRKAWDYYFYIDTGGHIDDPEMREAIAEMRQYCTMVKWLGSYPR
ncbi:chorismate mutase/prephenate dehydratase [Ereboglobus sp. PH5-10]|uniref:prephenate dehydratase n=1 Tax=Ereboglobus sp. PH5-10 TaxID=2940629 RepID=UPI0024054556|nr:prephenate dehydratase [Ereboglobus sp. PH5-10]MDF9827251.1 chorismate mutase/prephenate dehydratase [Ereboglobus sp. PH5-10]